ncbi:vacuolar protein sorting-associated protein 27-like [Phragmites australis]|uniref:vacuolar protein sorting-associated protein 27-like n=1 Tax=Phragmites australis TaxID=29695 RepID=UPI002D783C24|nr:vacuolar protein sorting-associated protein 27-like [Phragmites australis]
METPPPFQESAHCDVYHCPSPPSAHHCHNCWRMLCHEHSSYHMALPQFRIYTNVRVCYDCFNKSSSINGCSDNLGPAGSISSATESFSSLNLGKEDASSPTKNSSVQNTTVLIECKCGMPLCICEAPKPKLAPIKQNVSNVSSSTTQSNLRPKKPTSNQQKGSTLHAAHPT